MILSKLCSLLVSDSAFKSRPEPRAKPGFNLLCSIVTDKVENVRSFLSYRLPCRFARDLIKTEFFFRKGLSD